MTAPAYEFSTQVSIELHIHGLTIRVEQTCSDFIVANHPFEVPPGPGTLVLQVDDDVSKFSVYLPEGLKPERTEQPIHLLSSQGA